MRRALYSLSFAASLASAFAQDARVEQGARIFAANCSVPYCHGPNGAAGRAPKLLGHSFEARELASIVSSGIPDKGMPPFRGQLLEDDLDAVIVYLMTLRGNSAETTAASPVRTAAADAPGKALFFDAVRLGGCGRCHELENRGTPVAEGIKNVPADLRALNAAHTVTVTPRGEPSFPGIILEQSGQRLRVYDLSSPLPVLRTFALSGAEVTKGSAWRHQDAITAYTGAELQVIGAYLQSTIHK